MTHITSSVNSAENSPSALIRFPEEQTRQAVIHRSGIRKGAEATGASQDRAPYMTLRRAVQIAAVALQDETDGADLPFILHALRVTDACSTEDERIVALLHEVVGHSRWTLRDLRREGVPDHVVDAVHALTPAGAETRAASGDHAHNR